MPNLNSNILIEHLLKNKGPQGVNMNNLNTMPNFSQMSSILKSQSNPNPTQQFNNNIQTNNMMGMQGLSGMGGIGGIPSGLNSIPNYLHLNQMGGMNNQLLNNILQQGPNMNLNLGNFPHNIGGNNLQFPMNPMFIGGMSNNLSNVGQALNNNFKNFNNVSSIQPNEMNSNLNNINSKLNLPQQNSNLPMNLLNYLSQNQQNHDGNNNNISDTISYNQGNEIDKNIFKLMNHQNISNYQAMNAKSPEDLAMCNNSNNPNNLNNINLANQEQLIQYLMMNSGQQNSKNGKYIYPDL